MKNLNKLWFLSKCLLITFGIGLACFSQDATQNANSKDYQERFYAYEVGRRISYSLTSNSNCSIYRGKLIASEENKLQFAIEKQLFNASEDDVKVKLLAIDYRKPNPKYGDQFYSPWSNVDISVGNELILANCETTGLWQYRFVVSDKVLFSDIEKSVAHYIEYKKNPGSILDSFKSFEYKNNKVFLSYLVDILRNSNGLEKFDNEATVLLEITKRDDIVQSYAFGWVRPSLVRMIANENKLTSSMRDKIVRSIIDTAINSSEDKIAEQSLKLLISLSNNNAFDLKTYLNSYNKIKLLERYRLLPPSSKKESTINFEKLLVANGY
jgi:hypothetical protein